MRKIVIFSFNLSIGFLVVSSSESTLNYYFKKIKLRQSWIYKVLSWSVEPGLIIEHLIVPHVSQVKILEIIRHASSNNSIIFLRSAWKYVAWITKRNLTGIRNLSHDSSKKKKKNDRKKNHYYKLPFVTWKLINTSLWSRKKKSHLGH